MALPLLYTVIDFDNSDEAWQRYDKVTARELFKQFGVSERLYKARACFKTITGVVQKSQHEGNTFDLSLSLKSLYKKGFKFLALVKVLP